MRQPPAQSGTDTPLDHIEQTRLQVGEFGELVVNLSAAVTRQQSALERLDGALLEGSKQGTIKAVREAMTGLMLFQVLTEQIGTSFTGLEGPLVDLLADVALKLKDREQLAALSACADSLNSSLELDEVLYQAMEMLVKLTGAERAYLMLADASSGEMRIEISHNLDEQTIHGTSFAISRTVVDAAIREGKPIVTTNAAADPRFSAQQSIAIHSLRSIVCVPLKTKEKVIGVIYADHRIKTAQFSATDVDFVAAFASQASSAIDNARLFESVSIARNLMHNVFDSITSGVITTDMSGTVTLFNKAAEHILGLDAGDCAGLPVDLVLPMLGGIVPTMVQRVTHTGDVQRAARVEDHIEGRGRVRVNVTAAPLTDANDEPQGVAIVLEDRTEGMRFARERAMVKRYLPAQLVDSLADLGELQLGGARKTVSICFADIRGFTTFSEHLDPARVVEAINTYFGIANEVILENQGIVDKYMGDAVMAHYNSPLLPVADHAWCALKTASEIMRRLEDFQARGAGLSDLQFGIGVNTGEALAGNIGASNRMEYTLIGDAVNLAKRLQENAAPGEILLAQSTYALLGDRVEVCESSVSQVKGRSTAERVYRLLSLR